MLAIILNLTIIDMPLVFADRAGNIRDDPNTIGSIGVGLVKAKPIEHNDKSSIMKTLDAHPVISSISSIGLIIGILYGTYWLCRKHPEIQVSTIKFIIEVVKNLINQ